MVLDNWMTGDSRGPPQRREALVVEPQQRDHLAYVAVALDAARRRAYRIGKEGVTLDAALLMQIDPHMAGKAEMRGAIAVQVADLAAAQPEPQLAALPSARAHAGPARDLREDCLARQRRGLRAVP